MDKIDFSSMGQFGSILKFIIDFFMVIYEAAFNAKGFGWLWDNLFPDDTTDDTTTG